MSTQQYLTFYLDRAMWGLNVLQVREVLNRTDCTPVPHTSPHIRGLMNLRGQIVTVIDLAERLGIRNDQLCLDLEAESESESCIILKSDNELQTVAWADADLEPTGLDTVGIVADEMGRVIDLDDDQIGVSPPNCDRNIQRFVRGVVELEDDLLMLLRLDQTLEH